MIHDHLLDESGVKNFFFIKKKNLLIPFLFCSLISHCTLITSVLKKEPVHIMWTILALSFSSCYLSILILNHDQWSSSISLPLKLVSCLLGYIKTHCKLWSLFLCFVVFIHSLVIVDCWSINFFFCFFSDSNDKYPIMWPNMIHFWKFWKFFH